MSQNFEQFGKYILLEKLAAGGMAEVYLSKSTGAVGVSKFMAIKRILPQFSENTDFVEMFKEEAKIAINLNHSNIASIYDFGIEKSQFYIVMEYLEGKNLRQLNNELKKQNRALSIQDVVYIVKEASAGLDHAHRCVDSQTGKPLNIIHRDISPQNIMVSYEGDVKLIDFGIAKAENQMDATKAGVLKGKFGYMSPEQAEGQQIDVRSDIFAVGIVLWELLANERLFTASNEAAVLSKIRACQIPPIRKLCPNVPVELEKIVNKALAKDRGLRYESAAALHRDLNRFLNVEFPEFSPQEFSRTMKGSFADEFLAIQKKRIEYSKLKFSTPEEKTVVSMKTQTDIRTPPLPGGDDEELPGIDLNTSTNLKVDLSVFPGATSTEVGRTRTNVGHGGTQTAYTKSGTSGTINAKLLEKQKKKNAPKKSTNWASTFLLTLFIFAVGFLGYSESYFDPYLSKVPMLSKYTSVKLGLATRRINKPKDAVPEEAVADLSSTSPQPEDLPPSDQTLTQPTQIKPEVNLPQQPQPPPPVVVAKETPKPVQKSRIIYVKSVPTNAQIFINGELYNGRTPSHVRLDVVPNKVDRIVVAMEGFTEQSLQINPKDPVGINQPHTLTLALEPESTSRVVLRNTLPYEVTVRIRKAGLSASEQVLKMKINERVLTTMKTGTYQIQVKSDLFGEIKATDLIVKEPMNPTDNTYYEIKEK